MWIWMGYGRVGNVTDRRVKVGTARVDADLEARIVICIIENGHQVSMFW